MCNGQAESILERWYKEMWGNKNPELVHELLGARYTRHEFGATRCVSRQEYYDQVKSVIAGANLSDLKYSCFSDDDKVCAIGSWRFDESEWNWVQVFRIENGRIVETWLSGIAVESEQHEGWTKSGAFDFLTLIDASDKQQRL